MVQILPDLLLLLDEAIREDNGRHLRQQNIGPRRRFWIIGVEGGGAYDERGARGRRDASCEDAAGCSEHRRVDGVLHKLSAALVVMQQCASVRDRCGTHAAAAVDAQSMPNLQNRCDTHASHGLFATGSGLDRHTRIWTSATTPLREA